jgi:hypothetical protein
MFVRWQSRVRNRPQFGHYGAEVKDKRGNLLRDERLGILLTCKATGRQDVRWSAILVETARVDGKPRQRHVAYLASITESAAEIVSQRRHFWDAVLDGLDRLANRVSPEDRKRIETAIALRVPRLTREEHEASVKDAALVLGAEWAELHPEKPYRQPPT